MGNIASNFVSGGRGRFSGSQYWTRPDFSGAHFQLESPLGLSFVNARTSRMPYRNRSYAVGGMNGNIVTDEFRRTHQQGIVAPQSAPGLSLNGGANSVQIYVTFRDSKTAERSPLSEASAVVVGGTTYTVTLLPTTVPEESLICEGTAQGAPGTTITGIGTRFSLFRIGDRISLSGDPTRYVTITAIASETSLTTDQSLAAGAGQTINLKAVSRVDQVEIWASVNGALPRLAVRRQIGITGTSFTIATLALGEAFTDTFKRFPRCTINASFHDRQVMAGDEKHRDTLYFSHLFFPERYGLLSLKTRNGDAITGLLPSRDFLLVTTHTSSYLITGYTVDDIEMNVSEPGLGCSNHFAACLIGDIWLIPNVQGVYLFNGAWQNIITDRLTEWQDAYLANRAAFENGFSYHNPSDKTFKFCPFAFSGAHPESWVADYTEMLPSVGGQYAQPKWSNDNDTPCSAAYIVPPNTGVGYLYLGRSGGVVWREDGVIDANNLGTALVGNMEIILPHYYFEDPGGPLPEGKTLGQCWSYVQSENSAWVWTPYGGDEEAANVGAVTGFPNVADAIWLDSVAASQKSDSTRRWLPKTVHTHRPTKISGRGFAFKYVFTNPKDAHFRGLGGTYGPGPAARGVKAFLVPS